MAIKIATATTLFAAATIITVVAILPTAVCTTTRVAFAITTALAGAGADRGTLGGDDDAHRCGTARRRDIGTSCLAR